MDVGLCDADAMMGVQGIAVLDAYNGIESWFARSLARSVMGRRWCLVVC